MEKQSLDLIKLVRWILGILTIAVPVILLRGLFFGTAEGYPPVELKDLWPMILFFIAGVLILPVTVGIGKRKIPGVTRILLIAIFLFVGLMMF